MITEDKNFCRVFELPEDYPTGYLFGGGKPVSFLMVDWFNPIPPMDFWSGGHLKEWHEYVPPLKTFLAQKRYVREGYEYLVITSFGESFTFSKQDEGNEDVNE